MDADGAILGSRVWRGVFALAWLLCAGCAQQSSFWRSPRLSELALPYLADSPSAVQAQAAVRRVAWEPGSELWSTPGPLRDQTEVAYAAAVMSFQTRDFDRATLASADAALFAWQWMCNHVRRPPLGASRIGQQPVSNVPPERAVEVYHSSVTLLIQAAQAAGRLDPRYGIRLDRDGEPVWLKVAYHGFAWQPEDFNRWEPVGPYASDRLNHVHRRPGWGVPLVIVRERQNASRFLAARTPFVATALLRPDPRQGLPEASADAEFQDAAFLPITLELFNPLSIESLPGNDGPAPLAADLSAALAWYDQFQPRRYLDEFLQPDQDQPYGQLLMMEPYQPGKIPLVLIHGLLSDPMAWSTLANELQTYSDIRDRYQIWVFSYPTGKNFLGSAADLRRELTALVQILSEQTGDPALNQTFLIGHSMGGLLAKLQVTYSDDVLWNAFANRPPDQLVIDEAIRPLLMSNLFFEPRPFVRRVVFIGTPHRGAALASNVLGRIGASLVQRDDWLSEAYQELVRENRGAINSEFRKRLPTSVDELRPNNRLLEAMLELRIAPRVSLHTIAGVGENPLWQPNGDGVVPLSSARHPGVETERLVHAKHTELHADPASILEVVSLLRLHASTLAASPEERLGEPILLEDAPTPIGPVGTGSLVPETLSPALQNE